MLQRSLTVLDVYVDMASDVYHRGYVIYVLYIFEPGAYL